MPDRRSRLFTRTCPASIWSPEQIKPNCARPTQQQQQQRNSTTDYWTCLQTNYLHHRSPRGSKAGRGQMQLCEGPPPLLRSLQWERGGHRTRQDHPGALAPQPKAAGESRVRCHFCPGHQKTHYAHPQVRISPAASFAPKPFLCLSNWTPTTRNHWTITWLFCMLGKWRNARTQNLLRNQPQLQVPVSCSSAVTREPASWMSDE